MSYEIIALLMFSSMPLLLLTRQCVLPLLIFFFMTGLFTMGITSLVESSAVGATAATLAALVKGRLLGA